MDKKKIKIVKRVDTKTRSPKPVTTPSPRAAAREMVSTVTEWVADLKQRKGEEASAAFDLLFSGNRQPRES